MRLEMLREAVEVMRTLWKGGQQSHSGRHYTVENARVDDLPESTVPVLVPGRRRALRPADRPRADEFFTTWAQEVLPQFGA